MLAGMLALALAAGAGAGAKVTDHMLLLEPAGGELRVRESIILHNPGPSPFTDPRQGTVRIFVPDAARDAVRVSALTPGGEAAAVEPIKTTRREIYRIDFPAPPGETRFDIRYSLPYTDPARFSAKTPHPEAALRLIAPPGVSLKGPDIDFLGQEPATGVLIYGVKRPEFTVEISGAGTVSGARQMGESGESEGLRKIRPNVYGGAALILALTSAILALGFALLYRRSAAGGPKRLGGGDGR